MADESRAKQEAPAAKPPEKIETTDVTAPRPFPERQTPARTGADEDRYTREVWKSYARTRLGASPHAVAGALAHHDAAEEIGESAVREALDQFSVRRGTDE